MDKKLIIVLGVFLTVALCVAALYSGDSNHDDIPFKSIGDPATQSRVLGSAMKNDDLIITIETTEPVTVEPAAIHHSSSLDGDVTTVTIFNYTGQIFHIAVGNTTGVHLFGVNDTKKHDKFNETVTIINGTSKKPKMTIKLLSAEPDICTFTEIFEVTNFEMYTPNADLDFKARSVVRKGGNSVFKTEWFIEVNQSYVVNTTDYKTVQVEKEVHNNKTGKNETVFVDETVISGYHDETHYKNVWSDYNEYGAKLAKNAVQKIKVVYHKKAELGNVRIQTIPMFAGVECEELTWWNASWNYRRNLTINHSMVNNAQTNFPIMVAITQLGLNTNGNDIRITDSSDNQVAREIECYNATSGELVFYFNGTSISNTSDTSFWMYYNNSAATEPAADSTYGSQAVWDSSFKAVYLMNNNPNGDAASSIKDSTSNANHGTPHGAMTTSDLVDDDYGKGISFDGTNDYIETGNVGISGQVPITIESNSISLTTADYGLFVSVGAATADNMVAIQQDTQATQVRLNYWSGNNVDNMDISPFNCVNEYLDIVYKYDATTENLYVNTINKHSRAITISFTDNPIRAGGKSGGYDGHYSDTTITIVKISNIARSLNYITTTHNNLNNPTATGTAPFFSSFGAEDIGTDLSIIGYAPATPITLELGTSQTFNVTTNMSASCKWYINGSLEQTNSTGATEHAYTNTSLEAGYWNFTAYTNTSTENASQTWWVTVNPKYKPPEPVNLTNDTGNFWVNHSWDPGAGNVTDAWNVSVNSVWYNRTYAWYNETYSAHAWQNITVYAWNESGFGKMSD